MGFVFIDERKAFRSSVNSKVSLGGLVRSPLIVQSQFHLYLQVTALRLQNLSNSLREDSLWKSYQIKCKKDKDVINNSTTHVDGQKELDSMTTNKIYARNQLCSKFGKRFLKIYNSYERSLKLRQEYI